ncbi:caspase-like [Leguminivora glycinivorella]|uniref:caspase-like n=1 Tax=Leguminivora glycinivorella TaxID=1035111 RepID=UPI00200BE901|nr:caspase-like [Leguminivora glycinivorella]
MAGNGADSSDIPGDDVDEAFPDKDGEESLEPEYYDMSQERKMIIFNHYVYDDNYPELREKPKTRRGTFRDVEALTKTGENLNFDVQPYHDKTHDEIIAIVDDFCKQDHKTTSCVCVCILTHGLYGGQLFARDRSFQLGDIVSKLQEHAPGLVGKPKLVIVEACRGLQLDAGKLYLDGPREGLVLPSHVDTLVLRSSVEDFRSFRNGNGSWLIQEFCRVLDAKHRQMDLLQMIVIVSRLVAREHTSNIKKVPWKHNKKSTPEMVSTLIKTLRFTDPA